MNSNGRKMGEVKLPEGKMVAFQSGDGDPYPGIEIMLVTESGVSILSRTEYDTETGELKVIAYSTSPDVDTPVSITKINKDGDWKVEDIGF